MITIRHILKDGTEVESIEGHVIKADEFQQLYEVVGKIMKGTDNEALRTPESRS